MQIHPKKSIRYQITSLAGKALIRFLEFFVWLSCDRKAVFDSSEFGWVQQLEEGWPAIRREYEELSRKGGQAPDICDISEEQYQVIARDWWTFFPFFIYGIPIQHNIEQCPETARLLELIPDKTTVFFSILRPGSYIQPHRGAYKGYLRYHLGVVIPEQPMQCGIRIRENTYHWENGKSLIFDDTFNHDAWNKSDSTRVVLYVDFIRPMPEWLRKLSLWLTRLISRSPFVQNALIKLHTQGSDKQLGKVLG